MDFADENLLDVALALPNAVVVRTLSKAWGLAGLRVGFAAGPKKVIDWMRRTGHPYAVSSLSLALAETWLKIGARSVRKFVCCARKERREFEALLSSLGVKTTRSQGNFVYAEFDDARYVADRLAELGIAVRTFPDKRYLENAARISMPGNSTEFERLCSAMKTILGQEAGASKSSDVKKGGRR
jgi:histidinol-phosphate aminotransferase